MKKLKAVFRTLFRLKKVDNFSSGDGTAGDTLMEQATAMDPLADKTIRRIGEFYVDGSTASARRRLIIRVFLQVRLEVLPSHFIIATRRSGLRRSHR